MKNIRKIRFLLAICLLSTVSCDKDDLDLSYQELDFFKDKLGCMNMSRPVDSYDYPVYPTMDKWAEFNTKEEMMQACEISTKKLRSMSTQAIIQALWEYPFFIEIIHRSDHFQMDFESVMDNNAYRELEKRTDASICLLERFRIMPSICDAVIHPKAFEVLISQPVFLSGFSPEEKKEVIRLSFEKDGIRQEDPDHANSATRETCWLLVGRVMQAAEYTPFIDEINRNEKLRLFLETSILDRRIGFYYEETVPMLENLINHGKEFSK